MMYVGQYRRGVTIPIKFTFTTASGQPVNPASLSLAVYKNNDTVERTAGLTVTANFDSRTGRTLVLVDTNHTFYDTPGVYYLEAIAGTADGVPITAYGLAVWTMNFEMFPENGINTTVIQDGAITQAKIADNALSAAKFAAGAFNAVWTVGTRTLSSGANIALSKGTGLLGLNDPSTANIKSAFGLTGTLDAEFANTIGMLLTLVNRSYKIEGYAQGPGPGNDTIQLAPGSVTTNGELDGGQIFLTANTGAGQARSIISSVAATDTVQVRGNWRTLPDNTTAYVAIGKQ